MFYFLVYYRFFSFSSYFYFCSFFHLNYQNHLHIHHIMKLFFLENYFQICQYFYYCILYLYFIPFVYYFYHQMSKICPYSFFPWNYLLIRIRNHHHNNQPSVLFIIHYNISLILNKMMKSFPNTYITFWQYFCTKYFP